MTSMSAVTAITASQLGRLTGLMRERTLLKLSFLTYGLALTIMPFVPHLWLFLIPTIIYGVAHGINIPCIISMLSDLAPIEYRAAFMSANGMVLRIGQTLGPVVMGTAVALGGDTISWAFFTGAILAISATIALTLFIPGE